LPDEDEKDLDLATTPIQLKRLRPGKTTPNGTELSSPGKRRKTGLEERSREENPPQRWAAINTLTSANGSARKAIPNQPGS
jgi:hypothetical protein